MTKEEQALHDQMVKIARDAIQAGKLSRCQAMGVLIRIQSDAECDGAAEVDLLSSVMVAAYGSMTISGSTFYGVIEEVKQTLLAGDINYPL